MKFALDVSFKGHPTARDMRNRLSRKVWKTRFKFAFVRNPWDWMWSQYVAYRPNAVRRAHRHDWETWVSENCGREPTQLSRIADDNDNVILDFVGRFERLAQDWAILLRLLRRDSVDLPIVNRFPHVHYREAYTPRLVRIVRARYAKDIEYFGYEF
jgi:hypothetical protein